MLIRQGGETRLENGLNNLPNVYVEMFLQICRDYSSLPNPRTLTLSEIRFYYNGIKEELKEHTRPKG